MSSLQFSQIDASNVADHVRLTDADKCFFLFEYTSGKNFAFSKANQLITNLKKKPSRRLQPDYKYKVQAIRDCASFLSLALNKEWLRTGTLVPVPPSKIKSDPEYDDRVTQICRLIAIDGMKPDVRELVSQTSSTRAAHESEGQRLTVEELLSVYSVDESISMPAPRQIAVVDDVLTAGTHYRAMERVLSGRYPGVPIYGLFIARRIFPEDPEL